MRIPADHVGARHGVLLAKRDSSKKSFIFIIIVVALIFVILAITYFFKVKRQKARAAHTKTNSSDKLPSLFHWPWQRRHKYSNTLQANELHGSANRNSRPEREMSGSARDPERQAASNTNRNSAATVDRNTSIRSVMTLPAYAPTAREDERILGREGERGGIDTVVEFPETQDLEEARREDEMESLYQIRLARRAEAREREARREERRAARARGDLDALAEIRRRAEIAAEESFSATLIAAHQTANRERRVSSVQYRDLGVARHDGTRLRANSSESDNRPLLDSAASISGMSSRSRAPSNMLPTHHRGLSASSVLSSRTSDDFEFADAPQTARSGSNDTSEGFEVIELSQERSHSGSRSASRGPASPLPAPSIEVPAEEAPAYEDPPNYESPVRSRAPQLPGIARLPSIHVTQEAESRAGEAEGDGEGDAGRGTPESRAREQ